MKEFTSNDGKIGGAVFAECWSTFSSIEFLAKARGLMNAISFEGSFAFFTWKWIPFRSWPQNRMIATVWKSAFAAFLLHSYFSVDKWLSIKWAVLLTNTKNWRCNLSTRYLTARPLFVFANSVIFFPFLLKAFSQCLWFFFLSGMQITIWDVSKARNSCVPYFLVLFT